MRRGLSDRAPDPKYWDRTKAGARLSARKDLRFASATGLSRDRRERPECPASRATHGLDRGWANYGGLSEAGLCGVTRGVAAIWDRLA
jgi:hypothetical protein